MTKKLSKTGKEEDLPVEKHHRLAKLAERLDYSPEHLLAVLRARGAKLLKVSRRGFRVPESEVQRLLADSTPSAGGGEE
jgi:hypothetical protein